jgi:two-component system response regulator (stage 0 sporulation protein A)
MTAMERKIDVCIRFIAAQDDDARRNAINDARAILEECPAADNYVSHDGRTVREYAEDALRYIGVPCHLSGYQFLASAIVLCVNEPDRTRNIVSEIYPIVAEDCNSTPSKVERCIRHAVSWVFDNGDIDAISKVFGNSISKNKGYATNGHFIATMAHWVKRKYSTII